MIRRPAPLALPLLCAALTSLAIAAAPASAAPERTFLTEVGGFTRPQALSVDPSNNVWVTEQKYPNGAPLTEIAPYPSNAKIGEQPGDNSKYEIGGFYVGRGSLNSTNGNLYVADTGGHVVVFENGTGPWIETLQLDAGLTVAAVDNSAGASAGRIYGAGSTFVQAFEPDGTTHAFSASAPYIGGDRITGTPAGPFEEIGEIAADDQGLIYVADNQRSTFGVFIGTVDVFAPTGAFLRSFQASDEEGRIENLALDPHTGTIIIVVRPQGRDVIKEFDPAGVLIDEILGTSPTELLGSQNSIAVNTQGYLYYAEKPTGTLDIFSPLAIPRVVAGALDIHDPNSATLNATVDPNGAGPIQSCILEYGIGDTFSNTAACAPTPPPAFSSPTAVSADLTNLTGGSSYHARFAVVNEAGAATHSAPFNFQTRAAVLGVETSPATEITNTSATLNGSFEGEGIDTHYYFEIGTSTNYGTQTAVPPGIDQGSGTGPQLLPPSSVTGLFPNVLYHFRLAAVNKYGTTYSADRTFQTAQAPSINSVSTSHVTATSAYLEATIDPQQFQTTYHFEYGPTPDYGEVAPEPSNEIADQLDEPHAVTVPITGLQSGITYHFRLVAENRWGTTTSEDQTFDFFPPSCPNSQARQQSGAIFLPDCRSYELVSPPDAGGTLLFAGGPNTGQASSPSRFSFTGQFGSIGAAKTIETAGDLYVSTRTGNGWVTKYVGLPGDQGACMGGPPTSPTSYTANNIGSAHTERFNRNVLADPAMAHFLLWSEGPAICDAGSGVLYDGNSTLAYPSNAPYVYSATGLQEGRLPAGVSSASALEQFGCPYEDGVGISGVCTGEATASGDLSHFVFSSNKTSFAENEAQLPWTPGLTHAPGSAYDYNRASGATKLVSILPSGDDLPQDPVFAGVQAIAAANPPKTPGGAEEFIRFPSVSADGSHILMSTATAATPYCNEVQGIHVCPRFTDTPVHLYMRINDAVSYEIAGGAAVDYVTTNSSGTRVYFTSDQRLISTDTDNSSDLYEWTEEGAENAEPLTLLSLGDKGNAGDTDQCSASWTDGCGIAPYSSWSYSWLPSLGGNGLSDTPLAEGNGDIYFFSPEQLDGDLGILGDYNLYDYREGRPHFVAAFPPVPVCGYVEGFSDENEICSDSPIARFQVTPGDTRASFLTAARLTPYDNQGHLEMYSYAPGTGVLVCDSCRPDDQPPTSDAAASKDGLFLTDDGRTFFSTSEPLVPQDTNNAIDVYEYSEGRPQLITLGTGVGGPSTKGDAFGHIFPSLAGLVGVSANGTDVYLATYDAILREDQNGNFLRFYDARTGGGFPEAPPRQPCAAAEECHGPSTPAPALPIAGTAARLSGGNVEGSKKKKKHRRKAHPRPRKVTHQSVGRK